MNNMTHPIFNMTINDKNDLFQSWITPESILQLAKDDCEDYVNLGEGEAILKAKRIEVCATLLSKCCRQPSIYLGYLNKIVAIYGGWK